MLVVPTFFLSQTQYHHDNSCYHCQGKPPLREMVIAHEAKKIPTQEESPPHRCGRMGNQEQLKERIRREMPDRVPRKEMIKKMSDKPRQHDNQKLSSLRWPARQQHSSKIVQSAHSEPFQCSFELRNEPYKPHISV